MNQCDAEDNPNNKNRLLFAVFYLWTFVFLGRPQDIFTFLSPLRPNLILEVLVLFFFLINYSSLVPKGSFNNRQIHIFFALICIMVIGVPFAYHRGLAFTFLFTDYINAILFFLLFYTIVNSALVVKRVLRIACLGVTMYTVFTLVQGKVTAGRLGIGVMFDPNDLSYLIVSFLPLNFLFLNHGNPFYLRCLSVFNICFGSLIVLMTGSRSGLVGLLAVFFILLFSRTVSIKLIHKLIFVMLCLLLVYFNNSTINFDRLRTVFSLQEDYNLTDDWGRKEIWERGMKLMLNHPLTGVGVNCFQMAIGLDRGEDKRIPKWQSAHNSLIQIGTETGIIGLTLFMLLNLYAYRIFSDVAKKGPPPELNRIAEMARIGFFGNFVCSMFLSQAYSLYWIFYIALSAVLQRLAERGRHLELSLPKGVEITTLANSFQEYSRDKVG
jgi:putative inorganic carbon (HCO3(-)) transporter